MMNQWNWMVNQIQDTISKCHHSDRQEKEPDTGIQHTTPEELEDTPDTVTSVTIVELLNWHHLRINMSCKHSEEDSNEQASSKKRSYASGTAFDDEVDDDELQQIPAWWQPTQQYQLQQQWRSYQKIGYRKIPHITIIIPETRQSSSISLLHASTMSHWRYEHNQYQYSIIIIIIILFYQLWCLQSIQLDSGWT